MKENKIQNGANYIIRFMESSKTGERVFGDRNLDSGYLLMSNEKEE